MKKKLQNNNGKELELIFQLGARIKERCHCKISFI